MKFDLVITRHKPLVALLLERGLITAETPVIDHVTDPSILDGKHVVGVLPLHLASRCESVTEVPMSLTPADREAMQRGDLSLERTREIAGEAVTYVIRTRESWATEMHEAITLGR